MRIEGTWRCDVSDPVVLYRMHDCPLVSLYLVSIVTGEFLVLCAFVESQEIGEE